MARVGTTRAAVAGEGPEVPRLTFVSDRDPGYRRVGRGRRVRFVDVEGRPVTDEAELRRLRALAIPPAWTDVWACADPSGHLQAVGRDARGRKQYRYHPAFRRERELDKYDRLLRFARRLPRIRAVVERDLALSGHSRERVLALVVRLLELTHLRVGNEEYARVNRSFGLSTLRDRHATVRGQRVHFRFKGKSGKVWQLRISDRRIARIVRQVQDLPGQDLFQYLDEEGQVRDVTSADVNAYIREIAGEQASAKDFRTWNGTVLAARALFLAGPFTSKREAASKVRGALHDVALRLGNTVTVCRSSYVHPAIIEGYLQGKPCPTGAAGEECLEGLSADECAVLRYLESAC